MSLSEGKISISIAAFNAAVAVLFVLLMNPYFENPVVFLLGGLVTILNWVTVWHTYEYFVYEYTQLRRKQKIYRKIAGMEIRVGGGDADGTSRNLRGLRNPSGPLMKQNETVRVTGKP